MVKYRFALVTLVLALSITPLLAACQTETVVETVVVKEKETVLETVVEKETVVETVVEKETVLETVVEKETVVATAPPPEPTADPRQGGKLTLAWPSSEIELDPNLTWSGYDYSIGMLIYPTLYRTDGNGEIVPFLAESHEVSEDGTTWIFHLRPDFKFADGTPLTAEDVKYSFERIGSDESSTTIRCSLTWQSHTCPSWPTPRAITP
jgi:ABC-type transport system substrate-binding protein